MYKKYSQVVLEGENLSVFGIFHHNSVADRWEITNPIAFVKPAEGSLQPVVDHLQSEQVMNILGMTGIL